MILADDNFATIIKAVANGRNVYRNIKNSIQFLLSGNMAGIFCYFIHLSGPFPCLFSRSICCLSTFLRIPFRLLPSVWNRRRKGF